MRSLKDTLNEYGGITILLFTIIGSAWLSTNGVKQDVRDLRQDMREDRAEILAAIERLSVEIGGDIKRLESFHLAED